MPDPLILSPDFLCALIRLQDLDTVLRSGLRAADAGGPAPLGAPDVLARRDAVVLPPPFRGPVTAYASMRFTPLTPASLAVLTGYRGAEQRAPDELCFLVSRSELVKKMRRGIVFTDLGLLSGQASFYHDLSGLDVIDRTRLSRADFDASRDPLAPHRPEAEFLVWEALPPRGIVEVVCCHVRVVPVIEARIAAAGRGAMIRARADARFFFGRS